jgi:hypothetical protein
MRYLVALVFILTSSVLLAQSRNKSLAYKDPFLSTQWYLGFFAGGNLSSGKPTTSYYGYAPVNYSQTDSEKTYGGFSKLGGQGGLVFMFYTNGITIGFKPGIHSYTIEHATSTSWTDSADPDNSLQVSYNHESHFNYVEFPLSVQYDLVRGRIRPYVGIGGYYSILLDATRTIERSGTDSASGSAGSFTNQPKTIGVKDLYISSSLGLMGFIGASYDPGNIRITLDLGYKYGLNNITNTENRYLNNELTAIGEAADDIQLHNLYLSLGFVFPLKFISKNYNSFN